VGDNLFELLPDKRAVLVGMKPVLGGQEITDYCELPDSTPEGVAAQLKLLKATGQVESVQFDYVREDSILFQSLCARGLVGTIQEKAPFISLPSLWENYLESLERTDRKELKRKLKRLETIPHSFRTVDGPVTPDDFELFITLHRLSDTAKNAFMSEPMKLFFHDLMETIIPGWQQHLLFLTIEEKPAAVLYYFESATHILLYNSGFDPQFKFYSSGLMANAHLIRTAIEAKKTTFDFLRGTERYKYDLGATDCTLYQFICTV
jgi:hypothetical protein